MCKSSEKEWNDILKAFSFVFSFFFLLTAVRAQTVQLGPKKN
jgi:hypothetical protein